MPFGGTLMKVGDIMRVKVDQECTDPEACGQLCVIESLDSHCYIRIRLQHTYNPEHYTQHVHDFHLENP